MSQPLPGKGGNVNICSGEGTPFGSIIFKIGHKPGKEVLRFDPDGKVFVRGAFVDDNRLVYLAFMCWLRVNITGPGILPEPGEGNPA